jgi:hypothetical protein
LTAARCGHSATYEAAHQLSRAALGMAKLRRSAAGDTPVRLSREA